VAFVSRCRSNKGEKCERQSDREACGTRLRGPTPGRKRQVAVAWGGATEARSACASGTHASDPRCHRWDGEGHGGLCGCAEERMADRLGLVGSRSVASGPQPGPAFGNDAPYLWWCWGSIRRRHLLDLSVVRRVGVRGRPALSRCADRVRRRDERWGVVPARLRPLGLWRPASAGGRWRREHCGSWPQGIGLMMGERTANG